MKNRLDRTTIQDLLNAALRAYRMNDYSLAEKRLKQAKKAGAETLPFFFLISGNVAMAQGNLSQAERLWKRVIELDPDNAETYNNLGVLYRKQAKNQQALAAFIEAAEKAPDRPDIHYNIGNLHKSAGRNEEAIAAYNQAIQLDQGYTAAYNNLGTLYDAKKDRQKALEVYRRGLAADTGDAALRFNMGLVYQEEGRWDDAREAFDTALKSRPGWVPGLNNLGIVLQELGREEDAARTFKTLLDIEPTSISAVNNLGVAYERLGRSNDARECFRKALEHDPTYKKAAINLHGSYEKDLSLNEALEELNKQVTHHPADPEIRVRIARTLMKLSRWNEAEKSLDHVLERIPEHKDALRAKAELYLSTERPDEAETLLRRLPHDPGAVRDLASLYTSTGRADEAKRLLSELNAANPDDALSRRQLSQLLAEDEPEEALELREQAIGAAPGNTDDLLALAELYGRTGKKDIAMAKLDEAVNILGERGDANDLDAMNTVLGLYEKAAEALEDEKGTLFSERSAQLGRKLNAALGRSGVEIKNRDQIAYEEIPLEEEDALSLLDINAMEPVIRINEEEETVILEESSEDLEDAYTELFRPDQISSEPGFNTPPLGGDGGRGAGPPPSAGQAARSPKPSSDSDNAGGYEPPPVHIHLPPQSSIPPPPQVIYQDIRPTLQPPPTQPSSPAEQPEPEISVEDMDMEIEELPDYDDRSDSIETFEKSGDLPEELSLDLELEETSEELSLDLEPEETSEELSLDLELEETSETLSPDLELDEESDQISLLPDTDSSFDDEVFPEPDSDVLSEDLPDEKSPEPPVADLVFSDSEKEVIPDDIEDLAGTLEDLPPPKDSVDSGKMLEMFRYLSNLTDVTEGDGRKKLIEEGVPLKIAGVTARLSGEPKLREVAQKFDRRSRERHNIELSEERIKESLNAFKNLADAVPSASVRESLSSKLGKIMNFVSGQKKSD